MKMMRLPVFVWMTLITSILIIFAFPPITVALGELMFDRFSARISSGSKQGGSPSSGSTSSGSSVIPKCTSSSCPRWGLFRRSSPFSRKPLFGYSLIIFSGAVIGFLGFAVWSHHMFTTGLGKVATAAFSLLTMAIAVPTGVKIFNWIGTLWGGRIRFPGAHGLSPSVSSGCS